MSWTISGLASGIGDAFSSVWNGVKDNAPLLGAIAGGVSAYAQSKSDDAQMKSDKDYLNYKKGILFGHNASINAGPKEQPKQIYRK